MQNLFRPKCRSILGIDISPTSVKLIEISGRNGQRCVEGYGCMTLPPNAVDGHEIKDVDMVANCIRQLITKERMSSKFASIALPDSAVISKVLQVSDGFEEKEIEEFILMEADKYIPYPIDEINMDFELMGPSLKNPSMNDVLLVASRSENVNTRVEAVTKAGLIVKSVDVESFAIERTISLLTREISTHGKDNVVAVIDISEEYANLFVLSDMKLVYTREDEFGTKQLVNEIMNQYGVDLQEALQMKSDATRPDDYEERIVNPFVENLLLYVKRSLQFFFSTSHYGTIDHIFMAGGVSRINNLAARVQEGTDIATTIANPLQDMSLANNVNSTSLGDDAPSLLIACGLALRKVE